MSFASGMRRSAMKRAHSPWPTLEKVDEAWIVSCLRIMSWLMSNVVVLPSPTNATRPHVAAHRTAATRASGLPVQSIAVATPSPRVSSDRLDGIDRLRVHGRVGAELGRELETLGG